MIYYYGTSTNQAGHYLWTVRDQKLYTYQLNTSDFMYDNFNPETIAGKRILPLGTVIYTRIGKHTIVYIEGSCSDSRGGSKSVFFTDEDFRFGNFVLHMLTIKPFVEIIKQLPFEVQWNLQDEYMIKIQNLLNN